MVARLLGRSCRVGLQASPQGPSKDHLVNGPARLLNGPCLGLEVRPEGRHDTTYQVNAPPHVMPGPARLSPCRPRAGPLASFPPASGRTDLVFLLLSLAGPLAMATEKASRRCISPKSGLSVRVGCGGSLNRRREGFRGMVGWAAVDPRRKRLEQGGAARRCRRPRAVGEDSLTSDW